jgi:hypothetical protein
MPFSIARIDDRATTSRTASPSAKGRVSISTRPDSMREMSSTSDSSRSSVAPEARTISSI